MAVALDCGFVVLRLSDIDNLEGQVIGDRSDQRLVQRVVLHIVDYGSVVGVHARSFDMGVVGLERVEIPNNVSVEPDAEGYIYHRRTVLSSLPVTRCPASWGFQLSPNPSFLWPISSA